MPLCNKSQILNHKSQTNPKSQIPNNSKSPNPNSFGICDLEFGISPEGGLGGVEPATATFTESHAKPLQHKPHTCKQRKGWESNPQGSIPARPVSGRVPSPGCRVAPPFISDPGWTRTSDLLHVKEMSLPTERRDRFQV